MNRVYSVVGKLSVVYPVTAVVYLFLTADRSTLDNFTADPSWSAVKLSSVDRSAVRKR